jgi:hypothetical protein
MKELFEIFFSVSVFVFFASVSVVFVFKQQTALVKSYISPALALAFHFIYFHDQLLTSVINYIFRNEIAMYEVGLLVNIRFAKACSVTVEERTRSYARQLPVIVEL